MENRSLLAALLPMTESPVESDFDVKKQECFLLPLPKLKSATDVVGRYAFYNDSAFDGDDPSANSSDDQAIASDKLALLPGQSATFLNYTSFVHGINGVIVDAHLADPGGFSSNDLTLRAGAGSNLSDFERIDVVPEVTVRAGEGVDGSDRITITLPNGSVVNQYLQVTIIANETTGLESNDVFYFGNVVAETGNSATNTLVNADDVGGVRSNLSGFFVVDVEDAYDFDRNGFVNASDVGTARSNLSGFFAVPLITAPVLGNDYLVSSAAEIDSIASSLQPGDTVTMRDGVWTNQQIQFEGNGAAERPITLRAQTPGQVILNGSSSVNISGDWLVVDGLHFDRGSLGEGDHVVEFRGGEGEATNSRLTNSAISYYNPSNIDTRYFWVSLYGQNNRVDHNSFEGHNHSGVTVTVWRDSSDPDFHLIDNNYFADRLEGNANGFETIRVGTSAESLSSSFTTVESNLFENVDGEIEIISNKSGDNTFRYNTFRESAGTLTLRHGDNNLVAGNFFLGGGKDRTGGVRVIGENQVVVNNYFEGLDGRADGAISISAAVAGSPLNGYYQVRDAIIAHNTIVNVNDAAIIFDQGFGTSNRTLRAENVTIANNLISSTLDPLFSGIEGVGWTWEGNIAFGQSLGPKAGDSGITVVDPQLSLAGNGLWRIESDSPAINAGSGNYSTELGNIDFDGQTRDAAFDVGADEFSSDQVIRKPLASGDVGNFWSRAAGVAPDCSCLAIPSEDYFVVSDPEGGGTAWNLGEEVKALRASTLVASSGGQIVLQGIHASVLAKRMGFADSGVYSAYDRGRGFDSGSDRLYVPRSFGVETDQGETSNDGIYRWESGGTIEVSRSDLGNTLDFQIGKRERNADFDAIVFQLVSGLEASELDALFV
jgi:poly(beta-D-mannuronate) lyase